MGPRTTKKSPGDDGTRGPSGDDLAVVICAYTEERWDDILEAVESVRNQTEPAGEIVLVIDHNDSLLERARAEYEVEDGKQKVAVVANRHKRGLSGARNTGIESSNRPVIAFLDDDAVAEQDWIPALIAPYEDEDVVGVGGDIKPIWLAGRPAWWPEEFDWVVGCIYKGHTTKTTEIRNAIGANMSVRRSAFEEVGGFSSGLGRVGKHPVGAEETELYIRIRHLRPRAKVIYEPSAKVGHKVPASRGTVDYFRRRCYAEGLSKAVVSKISHSDENLSSEWSYTLKALPLGVLSGFAKIRNGDLDGPRQGLAIIAGLLITTAGYVRGRAAKGPERNLTGVPSSQDAA